jgi:hypothetical protein
MTGRLSSLLAVPASTLIGKKGLFQDLMARITDGFEAAQSQGCFRRPTAKTCLSTAD